MVIIKRKLRNFHEKQKNKATIYKDTPKNRTSLKSKALFILSNYS